MQSYCSQLTYESTLDIGPGLSMVRVPLLKPTSDRVRGQNGDARVRVTSAFRIARRPQRLISRSISLIFPNPQISIHNIQFYLYYYRHPNHSRCIEPPFLAEQHTFTNTPWLRTPSHPTHTTIDSAGGLEWVSSSSPLSALEPTLSQRKLSGKLNLDCPYM